MKITEFTVTHSFELYQSGEKTSHFVSAKVHPEEPLTLEEFPTAQLEAKCAVGRACIYNALVTGAITVEFANERISTLRDNTENLRSVLKKRQVPG